jgi:hypothetical protein
VQQLRAVGSSPGDDDGERAKRQEEMKLKSIVAEESPPSAASVLGVGGHHARCGGRYGRW